MAHSKFIKIIALFGFIYITANYGSPGTEWLELRATTRAGSPRGQRNATPPRQPIVQPQNTLPPATQRESCCWSILNIFCVLMEHAGNAAPHPVIYSRRDK